MSETFVRLKPTDAMAARAATRNGSSRRCARRSRRSRASATTSRSRSRTTSRRPCQRRARPGRAQDLRQRSRGDAHDARGGEGALLKACPASSTSTSIATRSVPQLQIELDRAGARARRHRVDDAAATMIETALAGTRRHATLWQGERPVPVRVGSFRRPSATTTQEIGVARRADAERRAAFRCASSRTSRWREGARRDQPRGATAASLALKFNVEGRDMGSVDQGRDRRSCSDEGQAARRPLLRVGRRVREPAARRWRARGRRAGRAAASCSCLLYAALGSARSALAVLATAPFALTGGAFGLLVAGIPLSVSAAVGFIALLGQVSLVGLLSCRRSRARRRAGVPLRRRAASNGAERAVPRAADGGDCSRCSGLCRWRSRTASAARRSGRSRSWSSAAWSRRCCRTDVLPVMYRPDHAQSAGLAGGG